MITDFIQSWDLFAQTYIAGWLIAALLGLIGVIVIARDQIFIGAAVGHASTLGIALTMTFGGAIIGHNHGGWFGEEELAATFAVVFAIAAAVVTARHRGGGQAVGGESHEAITGWVFLASGALAILVVTHSPHGLEEVQRLLSSTLIGANWIDISVFSSLLLISAVVAAAQRRPLLLLVMDAPMAEAAGMHVRLWNLSIAAWLGLCLGLSLRSSGLLYTFGCLVLPALAAKSLCRRVAPMFLLAPMIAVAAAMVAFIIAHHYDFPPAQTATALLSAVVLITWGFRRFSA